MHYSLLLLAAVAQAANLRPISQLQVRAERNASHGEPLSPRNDPWYKAPTGFERAEPGQVLSVRPSPGNLTSVIGKNCSAAYNVLYRTTDSRYNATWAVTTLFVPQPGNYSVAWGGALLSYQIPYDSADLDASPSYALYDEPPADIGESLGRGWFVSVPDYEGPLASFTAGVMSGHATIDGVRAVRAASFGLLPNASYAMWGYSGGALASEWAAELAVQYAPEMTFAGAALGGLTPNVTSVLLSVEGTSGVGLVPSGILGLASQHPDLYKFVTDSLKTDGKYNKTGFLAAKNLSLSESAVHYAGQNMSDYFTGGLSILYDPIARKVINTDGVMGYHGVPQMPLYVYKAVKDEISPVNDTTALVDKYCTIGVDIEYVKNAVGGHSAEFDNGKDGAVTWLEMALSGKLNMTGCAVKNVNISINTSPL